MRKPGHAGGRWYSEASLRGTIPALRDRLPLDEVTHLGAQLPPVVRGLHYEGWQPAASR